MAYYRKRRNYRKFRRRRNSLAKNFYGYKKQYNYYKKNYNKYSRRARKNLFLRPYYSYKANKEFRNMQYMDFAMEGERQKYFDKTGKII